jgi:hypothetical protein
VKREDNPYGYKWDIPVTWKTDLAEKVEQSWMLSNDGYLDVKVEGESAHLFQYDNQLRPIYLLQAIPSTSSSMLVTLVSTESTIPKRSGSHSARYCKKTTRRSVSVKMSMAGGVYKFAPKNAGRQRR